MNTREFNQWLAHYSACFPDTAKWLDGLPNSNDTKTVWRDAMQDVSYNEAKEVTAKMARGDLDAIPAYDREKTPGIIRARCQEAAKQRFRAIPNRTADSWRFAVKCLLCRDTGFAEVWSLEAISALKSEGHINDVKVTRRMEVARCSCERGYPRGIPAREAAKTEQPKCVERTPRLGECRWLLALQGIDCESEFAITRLYEWYENLVSPTGGDFAEWNSI